MLRIPRRILEQSFDQFRRCGEGCRECQVYWVSPWKNPEEITAVVHPKHRATASGVIVDDAWISQFWLTLAEAGCGVRVQVHTHPGAAFHSVTDDEYPLIRQPGFLSLVIPRFGLGHVGFSGSYLAEVGPDGRFHRADISSLLEVK